MIYRNDRLSQSPRPVTVAGIPMLFIGLMPPVVICERTALLTAEDRAEIARLRTGTVSQFQPNIEMVAA